MTDPRIYTAPAPLAPGRTPNRWTASGNIAGMQPRGSVWRTAEPEHGFPANTYLRADYPVAPAVEPVEPPVVAPPPPPPPVEPPVVTPPPPLHQVRAEKFGTMNDAALQDDNLTVGFNRDAGIGCRAIPPEVFRRPADMNGVGYFDGTDELLRLGRTIEGFFVRRGGVTQANISLGGFADFKGGVVGITAKNEASWSHRDASGLQHDQTAGLDADGLYLDVALANHGTTSIPDLIYVRVLDADQTTNFAATSTVIETGWSIKVADGRTFRFTCDKLESYPSVDTKDPSLFKPALATLARSTMGSTPKRGDYCNMLVVPCGGLAIGAGASFRMRLDPVK